VQRFTPLAGTFIKFFEQPPLHNCALTPLRFDTALWTRRGFTKRYPIAANGG
jgi:hypothetical protein